MDLYDGSSILLRQITPSIQLDVDSKVGLNTFSKLLPGSTVMRVLSRSSIARKLTSGIASERGNALTWYSDSVQSRPPGLPPRTAARRRHTGHVAFSDAAVICNGSLIKNPPLDLMSVANIASNSILRQLSHRVSFFLFSDGKTFAWVVTESN